MKTEIRAKNGRKQLLALLISLSDLREGSHPATDDTWSIQLLLMKRQRGHIVKKHMHKRVPKSTKQPQEAIVVIRGEMEARIYDRKGVYSGKTRIKAGECLLILDGAHEVEVTKNALAYAFKDGPYVDDKINL